MYGCESWNIKKAECQRIDAFELWCWRRILRVPWTARRSNQSIVKEILGVHCKDWCWSWNSNTWPPDVKSWLIWKDLDARKDWGQEKGTTEDEMVGWHLQLNGHEFGWTLGVGAGQGCLASCGSGVAKLDMTERLNWTRKGRGTRGQIANIGWITKKAREFRKMSTALLTTLKPLTVWVTTNYGKFLKRWEYQTTWPAYWEICL